MTTEKPPLMPALTSVTGSATPVCRPATDGSPAEGGAARPFPAVVRPAGGSGAGAAEGATTGSAPATSSGPAATAGPVGPRKVRMSLSKVDPWSIMKLAFLLSVAAGIMLVVAAWILWEALNAAAVFTQINDTIAVLAGRDDFFDLLEYVARDRVISVATMIGVADIVILTALATIGAFLYNIVAALVGGVYVTLTDE